jgi:hypothetical protein
MVGMPVPSSFFVREGDAFISTELTRGPWSNAHQHGGPPCALLARAAEQDAEGYFVARLTFDYFKPIPIAMLKVAVEPLKLGKTAQRLTLRLLHDGDELLRATALRLRRTRSTALSARGAPLPSPDGLAPFVFPFFNHDVGYHRGIEGRYLRGNLGDNRVAMWMRPTAPLISGEEMTGLQRVVLLADAEGGICNPVDVRRYTFVNPDLTVMLDRDVRGEWVCLDAQSSASELGVGIAQSEVHDLHGPVGRTAQTLVIEERRAP